MTRQKIAFVGFGNVARALIQLLERKRTVLQEHYDLTFVVTGISTGKHGAAIHPDGLDPLQALEWIARGRSLDALSAVSIQDQFDFIAQCGADVLFENTPVNHATGQPAIDHVRAALALGMHVITANKGTVVHGYRELSGLAQARGKKFLFESTVLGGTPLFSVFRACLPAAELLSFKGIINSTTNLILTRMEAGESFAKAVEYCQRIGIAETDPSHDVDGWDAAIKVAALVTVLMDTPFTPQQVDRTGIRDITAEMIGQAQVQGKRWKLVASAERSGDQIQARVVPELIDASSRLYGMQGATAGLEFRTDVLGDLAIIQSEREGMGAGPEETAYGLLADLVNTVRA